MSQERLNQSSELGRLVHSARGDLPDPSMLERVAARLPSAAPAPSGGGGAGSVASAAGLSSGAKWLLGLVLAGGVGAASYAAFGGGSAGDTHGGGSVDPSRAPAVVTPAASAAELEAAEVAEPVQPAAAVSSAGQLGSAAPSAASSGHVAAAPAKVSAVDSLAHEARLLERARRELKTQPAKALATTQEHKRLFPGGTLTQEREVIAIQALKALKRESEANSRAAEFQAEHPESAHQRKVESVVDP